MYFLFPLIQPPGKNFYEVDLWPYRSVVEILDWIDF
jgi:hypothetical protein